MTNLIIINGYTPPSPDKYDVNFKKINGAEEKLENGYNYIEQVRTQVPDISLQWTNIVETDAIDILEAVKPATFRCGYFFGGMKEDVFKCSSQRLTLKLDNGKRYYNLTLALEG